MSVANAGSGTWRPTETTERYSSDAEEPNGPRNPNESLTSAHSEHHCLGGASRMQAPQVALTESFAGRRDSAVYIDGAEYAPGPQVRRPTAVPFKVAT